MKKFALILFAILFSTSLLAHSPPQFNSKENCRKKLSMLKGISELKGYDGGEIIKFNSLINLLIFFSTWMMFSPKKLSIKISIL